jgi:hypothetical protein
LPIFLLYYVHMDYESPIGIIKRVGVYLGVSMPTDKKRLISELQGLEACRFDLAQKTAEWHCKVAEYRNRMLHPKDKDMTELDRTTMLDAHVAVVRKDYELLCKLEELVRDRIELGKTLLTLGGNSI